MTHVFVRFLPFGGAIVTHVLVQFLPSGGAIVTQMILIWQGVRSILDINCVLFFCVAAVHVCPFTLGRSEQVFMQSVCYCRLENCCMFTYSCDSIQHRISWKSYQRIWTCYDRSSARTDRQTASGRDALSQRPVCSTLCFARAASDIRDAVSHPRLTSRTQTVCRIASAVPAASSTDVYRCLQMSPQRPIEQCYPTVGNVCCRERRCVPDYGWLLSCTYCYDRLASRLNVAPDALWQWLSCSAKITAFYRTRSFITLCPTSWY
jgi:hypothetical protein